MKITSASKKVLASALSAAMVVAFAPAAAFGAAVTSGTDTSKWTEDDWIANGAVAKVSYVQSNEMKTDYYLSSEYASDAAALNAALAQGGNVTLLKNIAGRVSTTAGKEATLNLGSKTIVNAESAAEASTVALNVVATSKLTIKGGTIDAIQQDDAHKFTAIYNQGTLTIDGTVVKGTKASITGASGALTIKDGTFENTVVGMIDKISAGTFQEQVTDKDANIELAGGTFEVSTSKDNTFSSTWDKTYDAIALATTGDVTVSGTVSVKATAAGNDAAAYGIAGATSTTVNDGASLTVEAASNGGQSKAVYDHSTSTPTLVQAAGDAGAYGLAGSLKTVKKGTAKVTATAKDEDATAKAITGNFVEGAAELTATVAGDFEGEGVNAYAIGGEVTGEIKGGKYTGKVYNFGTGKVVAGSFTQKPTTSELKSGVSLLDEDPYWTAYTKSIAANGDNKIANTSDNGKAIEAAASDLVDAVANGDAVSNFAYAEGQSVETLKAAIKSGKIGYVATLTQYKPKTATDAEKADFAKIEEFAKGKNSVAYSTDAWTLSVAITNDQTKTSGKQVVYGYLTDLGTGDRGAARTFTISTGIENASYVDAYRANYAQVSNGTVADVTATKEKNGTYTFETTKTGMYAWYALSLAQVDEDKNEQPVATEKATQGIDVSKKSMTVKLGAKKTKLAKSKTFSMGASAETALTTSKKSGSKYITVSGQKVTLKKGVKRGTYTAKVSLKAAASDAYLAAAKTITVKFVIK